MKEIKDKEDIGCEEIKAEENNWQQECLESIRNENNVILSSPTGSGKTYVFLEWAKNYSNRPIYITAPIKALSNQRYRDLIEQGYVVGLETGDVKIIPENAEFICCTQEIYTYKYAQQKNATLIIDEFHYIFENQERARAYIDALHETQAENVLLCSATLGDMEKLKAYVEKVSKREFCSYENKKRLTSLEYREDIYDNQIKDALVIAFSKNKRDEMCYRLESAREEMEVSDEVSQKIEEIIKEFDVHNSEIEYYAEKGFAQYYGGLLPKEKLCIEKLFENRLIDTVVGTDALALGVNFPVENVVFAQLYKYPTGTISKNLFDQLAGRAGRKGYFDKGNVYYYTSGQYDEELIGDYTYLLQKENESIQIELTPRISQILKGEVSIEDDAKFIAEFSYPVEDENKVREEIEWVVNEIQNYNFLAEAGRNIENLYYLEYFGMEKEEFEEYYYDEDEDDYYYDDYYDEYYDEEEEDSEEKIKEQEETEQKIEEINRKTEELQAWVALREEEFRENIGNVYSEEFSVTENCEMFTRILLGRTIKEFSEDTMQCLVGRHAERFNDKLRLRKYLKALPREYRRGLDLNYLDDIINEEDATAINEGRGTVTTAQIAKGIEQELVETENIKQVMNDLEKQQQEALIEDTQDKLEQMEEK